MPASVPVPGATSRPRRSRAARLARAAATRTIAFAAPAKINLYLHVVGRRHDGYHLLDSLVVFAGVGDRVEAAPARELTLTLQGPFAADLQDVRDNLVLHAARLLHEAGDVKGGARLLLHKELPIASGIGGGSADAAAALLALLQLWQLRLDPDRLRVLALELGADVPACLHGRPALVGGIGEQIAAAPPLPPLWLVLANPGVALPTAAVFEALAGRVSVAAPPWAPAASFDAVVAALAARRNDLEAPALQRVPGIAAVLAALRDLPGSRLARMSGSGATCFALFAEQAAAERAAALLAAAQPGWWVRAAPVLP